MSEIFSTWYSRKGSQCKENRDACGVFTSARYSFYLVVDASERGPLGCVFIAKWIQYVVESLASKEVLDVDVVMNVMRDGHSTLRTKFAAERACYCAFLIGHDLRRAWAITCGDCRVGTKLSSGAVQWLTSVHRVANMDGTAFGLEHLRRPVDETVTRCLKASSFQKPEVQELQMEDQHVWVIASDGFWTREMIDGSNVVTWEDDASYLELHPRCTKWKFDSDADNYLVHLDQT